MISASIRPTNVRKENRISFKSFEKEKEGVLMGKNKTNKPFPHKSELLIPLERFFINGRYLNVYKYAGRPQSSCVVSIWQDENRPVHPPKNLIGLIQVLAYLLREEQEKKYLVNKGKKAVKKACKAVCSLCAKSNPPLEVSGYPGYWHRGNPDWEVKEFCKATSILKLFECFVKHD